jgi:hypothetical protein
VRETCLPNRGKSRKKRDTKPRRNSTHLWRNIIQMVLRGAGIQGIVHAKQVLGNGSRHTYPYAAIKADSSRGDGAEPKGLF